MLRIIYPETRWISEDDVIAWGYDQKVNDAVEDHVKAHGVFDEETDPGGFERFAAAIPKPTLDEAIEILSDAGVVTFARR